MDVYGFMKVAINEARMGVKKGDGGPFGAVIVKDGKVISKAHNEVVKNNDPTCHAEIQAIRKASKKLKRFDLSDCEIWTTCEPCPMCFAAIQWARIKKIYYGCTKNDAKNIGFDDAKIYETINNIVNGNKVEELEIIRLERDSCLEVFEEWFKKGDKVRY